MVTPAALARLPPVDYPPSAAAIRTGRVDDERKLAVQSGGQVKLGVAADVRVKVQPVQNVVEDL